jgi:hypothetical protein
LIVLIHVEIYELQDGIQSAFVNASHQNTSSHVVF